MAAHQYCRCLFCARGKEEAVANHINEWGDAQAICPKKIEPRCKSGVWQDVELPLLPGYVFVYSDEAIAKDRFHRLTGVIRVLTYGNADTDGYLNDHDMRFASLILREAGIIGKLDAIEEGNYVHVVDGLLANLNGRVLRVNRRKKTAYIELDMIGSIHHIWLGLQYIKRA